MTRELWLIKAVDELAVLFGRNDISLPAVRVSVGFPPKGALAKKKRTIGVCISAEGTNDKVAQIYISPLIEEVNGDDGILSTLLHELIHALGISGHGKDFKRVADLLGFLPPYTSTPCSDWLENDLKRIANKLGPFPHAAVMLNGSDRIKRDICRMLKYACPMCEYTIRLTKVWAERGVPECPLCCVEFELQNKD